MTNKVFITDAGLETDLIFNKDWELPEFAAYDLLRTEKGYETLYEYFGSYAALARDFNLGLILETPTWRANTGWGEKIGDSEVELKHFNKKAVQLMQHIRDEHVSKDNPIVISGNIGPKGDGYVPSELMNADEAEEYHSTQIATFAESGVDMIAAFTLNYAEEAIGIVLAAKRHALPACISFTVETDGNLPNGCSLKSAVEAVDKATQGGPLYYMINCAHPTHFDHLFDSNESWTIRVKGIRGNASCLSHAELDEAETLDEGNPIEFGRKLAELNQKAPQLNILGGCCGTDHRHIHELCRRVSAN